MILERQIRQVLAELELVSQAPVQNFESSGRDRGEDIGGRCPGTPSKVVSKDDREWDYAQKSVEHFRRRLANAHSDIVLAMILRDARVALKAWKMQPEPVGVEPEQGTLAWKRMIANSPETAERLSKKHSIGVRSVYRYREMYASEVVTEDSVGELVILAESSQVGGLRPR